MDEEKDTEKDEETLLTPELIDEVTEKVYQMLLRDIQLQYEQENFSERQNWMRR